MSANAPSRNSYVTLGLASVSFVFVFLLQFLVRSRLNWPPNSIPELIVSAPITAFITGGRSPSVAAYIIQGSLGWAVLGVLVGALVTAVPFARKAPAVVRVLFFVVLAAIFLAASFLLFPVPQGSGGITPLLRWLRAHGLKW